MKKSNAILLSRSLSSPSGELDTISRTKINNPFSSIRWKILFVFLLIVGISYYAVATSLLGLVGDSLFDERKRQERIAADQLAAEMETLLSASRMEELNKQLLSAGNQLGARLMVLDHSGKVQADTYSTLNGTRLTIPEVVGILATGKTADYGVHMIEAGSTRKLHHFWQPYHEDAQWISYCTAGLYQKGSLIGVLVLSSPIQDMMERLFDLQNQMVLYFLIAAGIALLLALFFSRVITRPIASLTKSIQRMGHGDLSVRVPEKGSGELRKLSETFNIMSEKLEMLDKSRNQFVSNASHELKTPLATMKILLESIIYQPDMETEMRTEFLTDINKEIDRLNMIIGDLLTLVSMDSKTMRLNRSTFSLAQVVTDTAHRLALVADKNHQELKLSLNDRCELYADCAKLTQVVYNLMENALKYTQEGGTVRVRLVRSGRDAVLTISDNGPGIPKEDQSHIFERFYRVDKARSRETGGTGLGLSIVHQMVLAHGGSVSVESEEGQGSTFTVEIPIHQS